MNLRGAAAEKSVAAKGRILLREVVSAARLGQKAMARSLLKELHELQPDNEQALMWGAALAETPEEAMRMLERVVSVNPNNQQALNVLAMHRLNPAPRRPLPPVPSPPPAAPREIAPAASQAGARVLQFRELLRKGWNCPLCRVESPYPLRKCTRCGSLLVLDDLQALAENRNVDERLVHTALEEWRAKAAAEPGFEACLNIARACLNLNQSAEALSWLKEALELHPGDAALARAVRTLESRKLILAVDDSQTLRRILAITLERKGFRVLTAADGTEAIARLNELVPNLILLDITMPRMDGYQVCKVIKQNPETKHIPVVMLSGNDGFFDKVKGRLAGATDYITKPFEEEELTLAVRKHLNPDPSRL